MTCPRCHTSCTESDLTPEPIAYTRSKPFDVCDTCGRFGGVPCTTGPCDYHRIWSRREVNTRICPACLAEIRGESYTQVNDRLVNAWLRAAEHEKGGQ
jgi:hypothetical protein